MFAKYLYMQVLIEIRPLVVRPRILHASATINFLIIFHADGERVVNKEKLSQLWCSVHHEHTKKNRRRQKHPRDWRPSLQCNFKHCMQQFNLFPSSERRVSHHNRPRSEEAKFLMQFSVRVKFTGKRQFPQRSRRGGGSEWNNKVFSWAQWKCRF